MENMSKEKQIKTIIDKFDFKRVHKTMKALNWKWGIGEFKEVPSKKTLKSMAHRLLNDLEKHQSTHIESGGFIAEDNDGHLSLYFAVEQLSYHPPEDDEEEGYFI